MCSIFVWNRVFRRRQCDVLVTDAVARHIAPGPSNASFSSSGGDSFARRVFSLHLCSSSITFFSLRGLLEPSTRWKGLGRFTVLPPLELGASSRPAPPSPFFSPFSTRSLERVGVSFFVFALGGPHRPFSLRQPPFSTRDDFGMHPPSNSLALFFFLFPQHLSRSLPKPLHWRCCPRQVRSLSPFVPAVPFPTVCVTLSRTTVL